MAGFAGHVTHCLSCNAGERRNVAKRGHERTLPLFPDAGAPGPMICNGAVTVALPGDGRALLLVRSDRGPAWLELSIDDRAWLAGILEGGE